jgi:decaprenylphospho-beta-D-ribofuranose 2-oxidase
MNAAYRALSAMKRTTRHDLFHAMFPFHGKEAYFALFGRAGFHESQVIIPHERFGDYLEALRAAIRRTKTTIAFAALKIFAGQNDLIRFDGTGLSLAIHVARNTASAQFLDALDQATLAVGGRPSIIKDSRLPRRVFESTYPDCDRFRKIVYEWDPSRTFRSELSTRLAL